MDESTPTRHDPDNEAGEEISLPSVEVLKKYDELHPGIGKDIIQNILAESQHRRKMEEQDQQLEAHFLDRTLKMHRLGLWLGLTSTGLILTVGVMFMFNAHPVEGASIICSAIVGLAACFIYGSRMMK
jgi:uncharacterized membrane protein